MISWTPELDAIFICFSMPIYLQRSYSFINDFLWSESRWYVLTFIMLLFSVVKTKPADRRGNGPPFRLGRRICRQRTHLRQLRRGSRHWWICQQVLAGNCSLMTIIFPTSIPEPGELCLQATSSLTPSVCSSLCLSFREGFTWCL